MRRPKVIVSRIGLAWQRTTARGNRYAPDETSAIRGAARYGAKMGVKVVVQP